MEALKDESYMKLAIELASAAEGQTSINPVVGCVVVKDGRVIGMGSHLKRGTGHAEVHALNMAGADAEGSTLYVTLEPCSHFGKTPPCADLIIQSKVKRVVVACEDPNPLVAGTGILRLRENGIEVIVGVLESEARALNEKFNKFITSGIPFVTLKTASTLDGKIASRTGDSKWISNEVSRAFVHTLRHKHQGIMVGVETVIQDNPSLTTRLTVPALNPTRIIIDSKLRTPFDSKVIQDQAAPTILITTEQADLKYQEVFEKVGIQVLRCGEGPQVDLHIAMKKLAELDISSILLEGGGTLNGAMLQAKLVDKLILFIAPKIIGGYEAPSSFQFSGFSLMKDAVTLDRLKFETFDDNICIIGYPHYEGGD